MLVAWALFSVVLVAGGTWTTSGSSERSFDVLSAIVLDPVDAPRGLLGVAPAQATRLGGRSPDWIELVRCEPADRGRRRV